MINLVGGLDGLSVLIPYRDPAYRRRRPGLAVGPPGERYGAIDLGRGVGLHPALAPLQKTLGRSDQLAVIAGVGVPDGVAGVRNHLPSRQFVNRGGADAVNGWAARLLRFEGMDSGAVWSFGDGPHPMFRGLSDPTPVRPPVRSAALARQANLPRPGAAEPVLAAPEDDPGASGAGERWCNPSWTSAADRLTRGYPEGRLGRALAATTDLIRADPGLRLVAIEHSGYDTHVDQGDGRSGVLTHELDHLARAIEAFWLEILAGRRAGDTLGNRPVTVVAVSEFGRTIDENGSGGTEHGRGGVALALGDRVVGGVHGDLPRLDSDDDWPVTVDVRRVLADAVASHGFRPWRSAVFPHLSLPNRSLGLLLSP